MDEKSAPWVEATAFALFVLTVAFLIMWLVTNQDHTELRSEFKVYRKAVEICTSFSDSGEELRRCVKEADS